MRWWTMPSLKRSGGVGLKKMINSLVYVCKIRVLCAVQLL